MENPLIFEAKEIVKNYSNHVALNRVSIRIPKNSIFGLLGPNGAGKTSLIRIINQITAPDSGELFLDGEKLSRKHIKDIGYLPEERGLYKKMKVGEQSLYLAQLKGMNKKEATSKLRSWFEKFEIEGWWNNTIEDLSKGMAQKIQFITTVVHEPKLLILDEPFSGFDPINTNLVKNEILNLKNKGTTVILSTHNMNSVEEICDNIALIDKSNKILEGSVKKIKEEYSEKIWEITYKGNAVSFANSIWGGWELINQEQGINNTIKTKIKLSPKLNLNDFIKGIIDNVEIIELNKVNPTMNDIFIKVVNQSNELEKLADE
ncbi:MAG: ATP-binding cassette domain-containing protein [Flavobacteriales bacterium]|jgi:ABC-2 type transport system ATP-binding protein|nr:ATP-binding cassette domain-containing protein [Flavobacteriales bacterium]